MNINTQTTPMIKSLSLLVVLSLGISLACKSLSISGNPEGGQTELPPTNADLSITNEPSTPVAVPHSSEWRNNWLHFGVDNQFSSYNPNETLITRDNVADLTQIWGAGCGDDNFSIYGGTPALYHGRIIVTYAGGQLEAGDPYTGQMLWHFGDRANAWAPPPVASTDGIIYYLYVNDDASASLYAINPETGQQIWEAVTQFKTGFNSSAQVTVDEKNDSIYILEDVFGDGRLYAVDRNTGEIKWFLGNKWEQEGDITFRGDIVPLKEDKLYVPAAVPADDGKQERMVRVDTLAQKVDIQYDLPQGVDLSWHVGWYGLCGDHLFESYRENSYLDPATLLAAHTVDQPGVAWQMNISGQSGRLACNAQKNVVYIPTDQGLLALNADTGDTIWNHQSINSVFTPTIANGIVYYISDTNMYALSEEDGSQLFRYPLGTNGDPATGVAVNDGLVVFSGSGGTCDLHVLGLP